MDDMLLKNLTRYSRRGTLTVRITRIWEHWSPDHSDLYGINFVMIDCQGGTMEGTIPKDKISAFKNKINEGTIYKISAYQVQYAREKYKTVNHAWRVLFAQQTVIEQITPQPTNFPKYGYSTYPISQYQNRIGLITLLSDVLGMITSITNVFPPSGGSTEQRRQIHITDGQTPAVVTLWGRFADALDAEKLCRLSNDEPVMILFVGMTVGEFNGTLAFKSSRATRWYINPTIPETSAILERCTAQPYQINIQPGTQNRPQAMDTTITALSIVKPAELMDKFYKLKIKITQVLSTEDDWWFMGCRQCWRKMKKDQGVYTCPICHQSKPVPRYKISLYGIDTITPEEENPKFAEFIFFGQEGSLIVGKEVDYLLEETRARNEQIPHEISNLLGKEFIVSVILDDNTFNSDHYHFRVKSAEYITNTELLAPLPLQNVTHLDSAGQSSSSALALKANDDLHTKQPETLNTPPPSEYVSKENKKLLAQGHEDLSHEQHPEANKKRGTNATSSKEKTKKVVLANNYSPQKAMMTQTLEKVPPTLKLQNKQPLASDLFCNWSTSEVSASFSPVIAILSAIVAAPQCAPAYKMYL